MAFLGEIQFEKVLAAAFILCVSLNGQLGNLFRPIPLLLGFLYLWMLTCLQMSELRNLESVDIWAATYWKLLVFFACLTASIRSKAELQKIVIGIGIIIFCYQLYSWLDFIKGGSYVYQQSMVRMTGVWSPRGGGYGSANGWGFLGLVGLPIAIAFSELANKLLLRILGIIFGLITSLCILYSGTRGAMLAAALFLTWRYRRELLKARYAIFFAVISIGGSLFLPSAIKDRALSIVKKSDDTEVDKGKIAASKSAESRLQGLIDGFKIANRYPIFGCGPAASGQARIELQQGEGFTTSEESALQLHNLYGQIVGELGYVGLMIWLAILVTCLYETIEMRSRFVKAKDSHNYALYVIGNMLLGLILCMLIYGIAGHTLYDWRWLVIFALTNSYSALSAIEHANCDTTSINSNELVS